MLPPSHQHSAPVVGNLSNISQPVQFLMEKLARSERWDLIRLDILIFSLPGWNIVVLRAGKHGFGPGMACAIQASPAEVTDSDNHLLPQNATTTTAGTGRAAGATTIEPPRCSQDRPGPPRTTQDHPGPPRTTQDHPGPDGNSSIAVVCAPSKVLKKGSNARNGEWLVFTSTSTIHGGLHDVA